MLSALTVSLLLMKLVNQTYFFISSEKEKSIEFVVISEVRPPVTKLVKNLTGTDIKVILCF